MVLFYHDTHGSYLVSLRFLKPEDENKKNMIQSATNTYKCFACRKNCCVIYGYDQVFVVAK